MTVFLGLLCGLGVWSAPLKVCVLDFTSLDITGQKRFLSDRNEPITVPPQCTLTGEDRQTMDSVMQGFVRMIDAWDNTRNNEANRDAQVNDNAFRRAKALDLFNTVVKGESRPMVIGADYLAAYLGRHSDVFACVDSKLVAAAMEKLRAAPDFPADFMARLAEVSGATHLVYGTVSDLRSKHRAFSGYGVETKTTYFSLDVIVKVVDLAKQATVYSNVYTGDYEDQRPISSALFDNNIFQNLMTVALQEAAEDLYERFRGNGAEGTEEPVAAAVPAAGAGAGFAARARAAAGAKDAAPEKPRLAVAEPTAKGGVAKDDIEAFWSILESCAETDEYTLVSREGLKSMMTEIGLTTSSDLMDLTSRQGAKLGKIATVKYLLLSEIAKFGTSYNCTLRLLDSSSGAVAQNRRANLRVKTLDELADKIEATVQTLFADDKGLHAAAVLAPLLQLQTLPPPYLAHDFSVQFEAGLLANGVRVRNLKSVEKIFAANGLDAMSELEPKMYVKVGKLLEVEKLVLPVLTRFELAQIPYHVAETGASGVRWTGHFSGAVRVIDTKTGNVAASVPFEHPVEFRALGFAATRGWMPDDYGKHLIKDALVTQIVPRLLASGGLKE